MRPITTKFGKQVHLEELTNQAGAGNVFTSRSSQEHYVSLSECLWPPYLAEW